MNISCNLVQSIRSTCHFLHMMAGGGPSTSIWTHPHAGGSIRRRRRRWCRKRRHHQPFVPIYSFIFWYHQATSQTESTASSINRFEGLNLIKLSSGGSELIESKGSKGIVAGWLINQILGRSLWKLRLVMEWIGMSWGNDQQMARWCVYDLMAAERDVISAYRFIAGFIDWLIDWFFTGWMLSEFVHRLNLLRHMISL